MTQKRLLKREARLERRQRAHLAGPPPTSDEKQRMAWKNGGRKLPGSQNRRKSSPAGRRRK